MVDVVVEALQEIIELVFGGLCDTFSIVASVVSVRRVAMQDSLVSLGIVLLSSIGVAEDLECLADVLELLGPLWILIGMMS